LIAKSHIVKLGRSLAVTQCLIYSDGDSKPVARANLTYSLPSGHI
jgi:acyl-coenzyme A thioesterase PaaI-like protein